MFLCPHQRLHLIQPFPSFRDFSFEIDRQIDFVLQGPSGSTLLDPGVETTLEVRVFNTGSESETFSLQINSNASSPIAVELDGASSVSVAADASAIWTLKATAQKAHSVV